MRRLAGLGCASQSKVTMPLGWYCRLDWQQDNPVVLAWAWWTAWVERSFISCLLGTVRPLIAELRMVELTSLRPSSREAAGLFNTAPPEFSAIWFLRERHVPWVMCCAGVLLLGPWLFAGQRQGRWWRRLSFVWVAAVRVGPPRYQPGPCGPDLLVVIFISPIYNWPLPFLRHANCL